MCYTKTQALLLMGVCGQLNTSQLPSVEVHPHSLHKLMDTIHKCIHAIIKQLLLTILCGVHCNLADNVAPFLVLRENHIVSLFTLYCSSLSLITVLIKMKCSQCGCDSPMIAIWPLLCRRRHNHLLLMPHSSRSG